MQRAFERLGSSIQAVSSAGSMEGCDALVLPGVGAFDPAMERLHGSGLVPALRQWCSCDRPLLGICLGLQLLFERSDEGEREGLGLLAGHVAALPASWATRCRIWAGSRSSPSTPARYCHLIKSRPGCISCTPMPQCPLIPLAPQQR